MSAPLPRPPEAPLPDEGALSRARRDRARRLLAALVAGGALGLAVEVGAALMLYSGLGMLSATGFLVGVALAALAAGVWVGAPEASDDEGGHASYLRWLLAVFALVLAAVFASLWEHDARVRAAPVGRAAGVLLLIAWPAYTLGALLGTLEHRAREAVPYGLRGAGVGVMTLLGAAAGVIWGGVALIPGFPGPWVLGGCAAALALAASWETVLPRRR